MDEKNIDLRDHFPKSLRHLGRSDFDLVVNMTSFFRDGREEYRSARSFSKKSAASGAIGFRSGGEYDQLLPRWTRRISICAIIFQKVCGIWGARISIWW